MLKPMSCLTKLPVLTNVNEEENVRFHLELKSGTVSVRAPIGQSGRFTP